MKHFDRIYTALERYGLQNHRPAVDEPANDFEKIVNDWEENKAFIAEIKSLLKPLEAEERRQRDSLADSLKAFYGNSLKEGVNNYELSNARMLKFTYKVDRKIDQSMIAVAREAYEETEPTEAFDALLRKKYELAAAPYKKLSDSAKVAVSRMITRKDAAPVLEVD